MSPIGNEPCAHKMLCRLVLLADMYVCVHMSGRAPSECTISGIHQASHLAFRNLRPDSGPIALCLLRPFDVSLSLVVGELVSNVTGCFDVRMSMVC